MRYADRSVFVTGAGSGIGRATAELMAGEGAQVACSDIDEKSLAETVRGIQDAGGKALALPCDITQKTSVSDAIEKAVSAHSGLQVLCNVAGTGRFAHSERVEEKEWNGILAVNLNGTFFTSQAALPHLLENKKSAIVNVASVAGLNGQAYSAAYCASKWGVVGLTKALAVEYVKRGLRVNCVCPSGVKTPMMGAFAPPEDADIELVSRLALVLKFTHPEEVADAIAYLASDAARSINGVAMPIDFGLSAT